MSFDNLRDRLASANPNPPTEPVDPPDSERAQALLEEIVSTTTTAPNRGGVTAGRTRLVGAVAAALALVMGGAALIGNLGSSDVPLVLAANGADAMASCLPFDEAILAEMSPAFAGTVIGLTESVATIEVDRWYAGEPAETVELRYTPGFEALIGTPAMEIGQRYLITAAGGAVNGCGYSGIATPEYEAAFDRAFGN